MECRVHRQNSARTAGRITLSYSTRDTREFRETFASWLMLQAFRLQQGNATVSYRDMRTALGEPASNLPDTRERSSSLAGWWLRSVVGTGTEGTRRRRGRTRRSGSWQTSRAGAKLCRFHRV